VFSFYTVSLYISVYINLILQALVARFISFHLPRYVAGGCVLIYAAQEWINRTVAEHACSKMGCAAAKCNAPQQPRAIRAGPNEGAKKSGAPIPEVYPFFSSYRGVHRIFFTYFGFIRFFPHTGGLTGFLLNTGGLSDPPIKTRGFIEDILCFCET